MNCPLCGETCRCDSDPPPAPLRPQPEENGTSAPRLPLVPGRPAPDDIPEEPGVSAWREEICARVNHYRARRKMRPPRYPSLRLRFETTESPETAVSLAAPEAAFVPVSDQALALDGMKHKSATGPEAPAWGEPVADAALHSVPSPCGNSGAKILEFPRLSWTLPAPPADQLAEPVIAQPRILEVPEIAPDPPALGGITIEPSGKTESREQPGIDAPLCSSSLLRRILAGAIDGLIILFACALFGAIFWKVAAIRPPLLQMLSSAAGILCMFWAAYQYLLIVYAASTPGLRLVGLKLTRFDGAAPKRSLRRWRVLASFLSAASLGMGFAWALLDEDSLCWHDRITRTCLAPKGWRGSGPTRSTGARQSASEDVFEGGSQIRETK